MKMNEKIRADELLTPAELAEELKVPRTWIYTRTKYRGEGAIPRIHVGKYIRFRREEVMAWLERQ